MQRKEQGFKAHFVCTVSQKTDDNECWGGGGMKEWVHDQRKGESAESVMQLRVSLVHTKKEKVKKQSKQTSIKDIFNEKLILSKHKIQYVFSKV